MSKVLIAVTACHRFDYDMRSVNDCMVLHRSGMDFTTFRPPIIRETWWNDVPSTVEKKFFYGMPPTPALEREPLADEVFLPVKDGYAFLPHKTRALCIWALRNGYAPIFKGDDDTFLFVERLLKSGFEKWPWIGRFNGGEFVAGGPGYWLDKSAMEVIAASTPQKGDWAEDIWVSRVLQNAGFKPYFDPRYVDLRRGVVDSSTVAVCECDGPTMRKFYESTKSQVVAS